MTIQDTSQTDVAPLSTSSSPEELQAVMDVARAAVESQRELEEQGIDPLGPTDADDDDLVDDDEDLGDEEAEPEQPRQDHATADVPVPTTQDIAAVREMFTRSGSQEEFEVLQHKAIANTATQDERAKLKAMAEWRQILGPLYRTLMAEGARIGQAQRATPPTTTRPAASSSTSKPTASKPTSAAPAKPKAPASTPAKKPVAAAAKPKAPKLPPMLNLDGTLNADFEALAHSGALYGREKLTED